MTLTPGQLEKIYRGLPDTLAGCPINKPRSRQFLNSTPYPRLVFSVISQGIPVSDMQLLTDYLNDSKTIRTEVWRQQMKARLTLILQTQDQVQADALINALVSELYAFELGVNPVNDFMQMRGADPPMPTPPYQDPDNKKLVQGYAVDIFVEYMFTWRKYFDVIRSAYIEYKARKEGKQGSEFWYTDINGESNAAMFYSIDVIIKKP
jgi:hypothetical protein